MALRPAMTPINKARMTMCIISFAFCKNFCVFESGRAYGYSAANIVTRDWPCGQRHSLDGGVEEVGEEFAGPVLGVGVEGAAGGGVVQVLDVEGIVRGDVVGVVVAEGASDDVGVGPEIGPEER